MRTGRCLIPALVVLVGGCSVAGTPKAAPPPANRTLVQWANVVCTQAKLLDEFQDNGTGGKIDYIFHAHTLVDDVLKRLKAIQPAKIAKADEHVAQMVKQLEELKPQLPPDDERPVIHVPPDEQASKARQAAEVMAKLGPQRPQLQKMVERDFVHSYNAAPACTPTEESRERELTRWADAMCDAVKTVGVLRSDANALVDDPGYQRDELTGYISSAPTLLRQIAEPLGALRETGVKEADDLRTGLLDAVKAAQGKVPQNPDPQRMGLPQLNSTSGEIAVAVAPIKPKIEGFPAVVEKGEDLAKAYRNAPNCDPPDAPKPPLAPRDGVNYEACRSGTCQVAVGAPVDIFVHDLRFRIAVRTNTLNITGEQSRMTLSGSGQGRWNSSGGQVVLHVSDMKPYSGVLDISTR